jgi:4-hydroxy-tetrahydrodipicolinate synthase
VGDLKDFGTVITSMITPFDDDLRVDLKRASNLLDYLIQNGTDSIVVGTPIGECGAMTRDEKLLLYKHMKSVAYRRAKIIVNVETPSLDEAIRFVDQIEDLGYGDGVLLGVPNYLGLNQEAIYQFIETVSEYTELPILIHNKWHKIGSRINSDTIIRLSRLDNVVGVQESNEDMRQITKIITETSDDFQLYCGDDRLTLPILSLGGKGVVSMASHINGKKIKEMISHFKAGRIYRASELNKELSLFFDAIYEKENPNFIKDCLNFKGIEVGKVRNIFHNSEEDNEMFLKLVFASSI